MKSENGNAYRRINFTAVVCRISWLLVLALALGIRPVLAGLPSPETCPYLMDLMSTLVPSDFNSLSMSNATCIRFLPDDQLATLLNTLNATPQLSCTNLPRDGRTGNFFSLEHPEWPPLPQNSGQTPVWAINGGYLMSDIGLNYDALTAVTVTSKLAATGSKTQVIRAKNSPPVPGGGGTNTYNPNDFTNTPVNYGTNLWISPGPVVAGVLTGFASNTVADIYYEIQSRTNLVQSNWQSEGFISGSELTNWTQLSVPQNGRPNLFLRLRSWADDTGTGIPDWWWLQYFGQITNVNPYSSVTGDGFNNLYKFQNGLVPTNYFNPNGPPGFFGYLDATGTNVFIAWSPAPGPVLNYSIQRGISNSVMGTYVYSQVGTVSSNANFIEDAGVINNSNALNNVYQLEAVYPNSLSGTDTWSVRWFIQYGTNGLPYGPPAPTNFYACADTNATNVLLSWSPASGVATNYLIERGIFNTSSNAYVYSQIASVNPATNTFKVTGPFTNAANWSDDYAVIVVYPGNVRSPLAVSPVNVGFTNGLAAPASFYGYADGTGTNLILTWTPAAGTPTNYVLFEGNTNSLGSYAYIKLATVIGTTNSLVVTNGFNNLYQAYAIFAVYTDGSFSRAAFWQSANRTPAPGNFVAYFDATVTNVWLSWTAPTGSITGYIVTRFDPLGQIFQYNVSSNTTWFEDTNAVHTGSFDPTNTEYTVQALYPLGGASSTAIAFVGTPPAPTGLRATLDGTGKNVNLTWSPVPGAMSYVIERGVMNPSTGIYTYSPIGTVNGSVSTFTDAGAITGVNSYNNRYEVEAVFPGGVNSAFDTSAVSESSAVPLSNVYVSADLVRNGTGRWQVMFSGLPTNSPQTVQLTFTDDFYDVIQTNLSTTSLTNGIYQIPDALALEMLNYGFTTFSLTVQLFGPNGEPGQVEQAGYIANDAPYFVDGRQHLKQNLNFLVRAAAVNQLFFSLANAGNFDVYGGQFNQTSTSFEEFSFLHHSAYGQVPDYYYFQLDDLWPFTANYELANYFVDTTRTQYGSAYNAPYGSTNFTFVPNFATNVPAPAILAHADPYWILQPGFGYHSEGTNGSPESAWAISTNSADTSASLASGSHNLFGLSYNNGCIIGLGNSLLSYQSLAPGNSVTTPSGYQVAYYASWCLAPTLQPVNYYFAPLINPGINVALEAGLFLPGEIPDVGSVVQPFPVPIEEDFSVTNQSPPLIATVGQPMIIGGWAKYSIQGSSPTKYAYLGQYFMTNAFLLDSNGVPTTNSAGVMSPYGEFFPLQAGSAQIVTMPDIDPPYQQGTNAVKIISMNVDANHDGVMDLSYQGPDQNSPSRPFRFWIDDSEDVGDFGGTGVPGQGVEGNGMLQINTQWVIHGRRDLVNFFPVYLNFGSLFQSNVWSAGISTADTNWQFVLSQADSVLRFAYTDLTPTNYMNFLRDTNESGKLAYNTGNPNYAALTTIGNRGVALSPSFVAGIATNNQGIILVEAAARTAQPLMLTIYHGTNQIAQTSLYLSISGVEQMFRYKNLLIGAATNQAGLLPDRLTDASVTNEPDTIDKNVAFVHGYNVSPYSARGWFADIYKRLYWSGCHAKFYGVNWYGNDSQGDYISGVTANYQTNVVHAIETAPLLANFIAKLTNGPTVVLAHSLGNMVALSALSDYNAPMSQFFMLDAAVPIEAIDGSTPINTNMVYSTSSNPWLNYSNALWASKWFNVWPSSDARSTLTWSNRLANFGSTAVYNYYSSGEEVLRTYSGAPPSNLLSLFGYQLVQWLEGQSGTFVWAWQEMDKGLISGNTILSSDHGGWGLNENLNSGYVFFVNGLRTNIPPGMITNSVLQTNAFFDMSVDTAMFTTNSTGNSYAQTYRDRILSDAIPAVTLPIGANSVSRLLPPRNPTINNFDMQTVYENGWPLGRGTPSWPPGTTAFGEWHHSDVRIVANTFTYQLFDKMVSTGSLK